MPTRSAADRQAFARFGHDLRRLIDPERDTLLVAVSGGADSLALLLLGHALLGDRCVAATVDHGLRPEAAAEADLVAAICATRGIAHVVLRDVLPTRAGRTANLHARARALRYRLLEAEREARGFDWVATGHHADDQLETFLMRANRGAGVAGLAAVRARSGRVVRPLLGWRRDELAAIVAREGLVPIVDPSNTDARFDRARLRRRLATADWLDPQRIGVSTAALADAEDALAWAADRAFAERVVVGPALRSFHPDGLPVEIARRVAARCVIELDPEWVIDGPALSRLLAELLATRAATLGAVAARPGNGQDGVAVWHFRPAPPRRSA